MSFLQILEKNPEIGMLSTALSVGITFVDVIAVVKIVSIVVGLLIGLITLYIKIVEAIRTTREFKKLNKNDKRK